MQRAVRRATSTSTEPGRRSSRLAIFLAALLVFAACGGSDDVSVGTGDSGGTVAGVGVKPLIVALCHGENQTWPESLDQAYFQSQFEETGGSETIADYWRDISHGNFSIQGSRVLDVQLDRPRDDIGDRDDDDFGRCRDGVNDQYDIDWNEFAGPVVIKPATTGETVAAIDADDTEVQVRTSSPSVMDDWPAAPFILVLTTNGSLWRNADEALESVRVTGVSKDYDTGIATFTIEREQEGYRGRTSPAKPFPAGTTVRDISDTYGSKNRTAVVGVYASPSVINQELGHFFGFDHSRKLSTATSGYGNCFDVMSTLTCTSHYFEKSVQGSGTTIDLWNGPGMTSIFLDINGWIDPNDVAGFCTETDTFYMRALGVSGTDPQQVRVPIQVPIRDGVTSDYLTVELRSQVFAWDQGIPQDAFVLNLKGDDGLAYLVDDAPGGTSGMVAGDEYTFGGDNDDPLDDMIFTVQEIDSSNGTGTITIRDPNWIDGIDDCIGRLGGGSTTGDDGLGTDDDPDSSTSTSTSTTEPTEVVGAACVPGEWLLDAQAFVDEIIRIAAEGGAPFPGEMTHDAGSYTMSIAEDGTTTMVRGDWTLRMTTDQGTIYMVLDGTQQGSTTWDDIRMEYFESGSTVTVSLEIELNGVRQPVPTGGDRTFETDAMGGIGTYECVGDTMTVVEDGSGVVAIWYRIG